MFASENIPFNFADVSVTFFGKKTYSKQWYESCVRGFLVFFSIFVRKKVTINENSDGNDVKISRNDDIVIF